MSVHHLSPSVCLTYAGRSLHHCRSPSPGLSDSVFLVLIVCCLRYSRGHKARTRRLRLGTDGHLLGADRSHVSHLTLPLSQGQ